MSVGGLGGYKLYGGATRPDAISGLNPTFSAALQRLYEAAPPDVQAELGLNSAYRSIKRQRELWNASDKSGKMVARPGKSRHNLGTAADLYGFGLGGNSSVSQATKNWVRQNAPAYGLTFPMSYEPWHIQMAGEAGNAVPASYNVGPGFRGPNPAYVAPPSAVAGGLGAGSPPGEKEDPVAAGQAMLKGLGTPMLSEEDMLALALAAMKRRTPAPGEPPAPVKIARTPAQAPRRFGR